MTYVHVRYLPDITLLDITYIVYLNIIHYSSRFYRSNQV